MGASISGWRLAWTGQLRAPFSRRVFCSSVNAVGIVMVTGKRPIRRFGVWTISLVTAAVAPSIGIPCRSAMIPMIVSVHVASAAPTRSVGENNSPRPWLSTGASVWSSDVEGA